MKNSESKTRSKKGKAEIITNEIAQENLLDFTKRAMLEYGKYTLESRAIPDFRDGLKPVHRRILWAANGLGLSASKGLLKKSARLVGDVLGKYHPHGDTAVYEATVNLVHLKQPLIFGSGNWGTQIEGAAASRYTECRLQEYADDVFFNKSYLPVTDTVFNFDNTDREPVVLNALLPNLLLNGSFGIATGGRCSIPAFEPEGVITLTRKAIQGKPVTIKDCTKHLVPTCAEGAYAWLEDQELENLKNFYETGYGAVYWVPETEYNEKEKSIIVSGFAPKVALSLESTLKKIASFDWVASVSDISDIDENGKPKLTYEISLKNSIAKNEVSSYLDEISYMFESNQTLVFATTTREKIEDQVDVKFEIMNMPKFFFDWATYRIDLEKKAIKHQASIAQTKLERAELLLLAVLNRDLIIKALDKDDVEAFLVKQLKITKEQANAILELKVKQLKRLDEVPLKKQIKELKDEIKQLKSDYKDPTNRILATLTMDNFKELK